MIDMKTSYNIALLSLMFTPIALFGAGLVQLPTRPNHLRCGDL